MKLMFERIWLVIWVATPLWIVGWHYGINTPTDDINAVLWISSAALVLNVTVFVAILFNWIFIKSFKK
ncbi:hypothetical protein [Priestia megaterium]|uniref:hypothetical protein n=1 Tax=Priestia megaterium TaxID=1404 RepID=UPI00112E3F39|nr:hypothetical protein [Priestia megaterium]TPF18098.1 hypothetical protein CBE78_02390 [Priestia megaterium]TPF22205.1 hypothetical protein CBE79_04895 [Priestia megaterium]